MDDAEVERIAKLTHDAVMLNRTKLGKQYVSWDMVSDWQKEEYRAVIRLVAAELGCVPTAIVGAAS